jgi:hypothetical protein
MRTLRTISAMFWTSGDSPGAFLAYLLLQGSSCGSGVHISWLWRLCNGAVEMGVRGDKLALTSVPQVENFRRRRTPENTRVNEPCETDAGNVARTAEDAFEVPDRFRTVGGQCVILLSR